MLTIELIKSIYSRATIHKIQNGKALISFNELSYFKNGKANMHIKTKYQVIELSSDGDDLDFICWAKNKSEGLKELRS